MALTFKRSETGKYQASYHNYHNFTTVINLIFSIYFLISTQNIIYFLFKTTRTNRNTWMMKNRKNITKIWCEKIKLPHHFFFPHLIRIESESLYIKMWEMYVHLYRPYLLYDTEYCRLGYKKKLYHTHIKNCRFRVALL